MRYSDDTFRATCCYHGKSISAQTCFSLLFLRSRNKSAKPKQNPPCCKLSKAMFNVGCRCSFIGIFLASCAVSAVGACGDTHDIPTTSVTDPFLYPFFAHLRTGVDHPAVLIQDDFLLASPSSWRSPYTQAIFASTAYLSSYYDVDAGPDSIFRTVQFGRTHQNP